MVRGKRGPDQDAAEEEGGDGRGEGGDREVDGGRRGPDCGAFCRWKI